MIPPVLSVDQCRRIDRYAIDALGVPGVVLMENAGRGATDALLDFDPSLAAGKQRVGIVCGKGNNAGDGFVVARHLATRGVPATLVLLSDSRHFGSDAAVNYFIAEQLDLPRCELSHLPNDAPDAVDCALDEALGGCAWLVDAMLGTGATGPPRPPFDIAVRWMNRQAARRMALDVPTGLDADTGAIVTEAVRADLTCTFAADKLGYANAAALPWLGEVRVIAIGLPPAAIVPIGA